VAHYVLVCGGRDFANRHRMMDVIEFLARFYGDDLRIMHGAAKGADTLAGDVAAEFGVRCKAFPADWNAHGKKAGPIRNQQMLDYLLWCQSKGHSVQVVAFAGGRGTADMTARAEAAGITVDRN